MTNEHILKVAAAAAAVAEAGRRNGTEGARKEKLKCQTSCNENRLLHSRLIHYWIDKYPIVSSKEDKELTGYS